MFVAKFKEIASFKKIFIISFLIAFAIMVVQPMSVQPIYAQNQNVTGTASMNSNTTASTVPTSDELKEEMKKLSTSKDPVDIATFPLCLGISFNY